MTIIINFEDFIKYKNNYTNFHINYENIISVCNKNTGKKIYNKVLDTHPIIKSCCHILNKFSESNIKTTCDQFLRLINCLSKEDNFYTKYILNFLIIKSLIDKKYYNLYIILIKEIYKYFPEDFLDMIEIVFYNHIQLKTSMLDITIFYNLLYSNNFINDKIVIQILNYLFENKFFLEMCNFLHHKEFENYIKDIQEFYKDTKIPNIIRFRILDLKKND